MKNSALKALDNPKLNEITKFERHNPELVKLIEDYTQHSIEENFDCLIVPVIRTTIPNCPPNEYDSENHRNKEYHYLNETAEEMTKYLHNIGYKATAIHSHLAGIKMLNGKQIGAVRAIKAYKEVPEEYKGK